MMGKYGLCPEMWEHPEIHIRIRLDRGQEQGVISAVRQVDKQEGTDQNIANKIFFWITLIFLFHFRSYKIQGNYLNLS